MKQTSDVVFRMVRPLVFTMAWVVSSAALADMSTWREYFVSDSAGNDAWDGTTNEWAGVGTLKGPKKTIQAAVALADGNGTIVTVAPGVYDEGGVEVDSPYVHSNRVYITQKNVFLRSSGGKEVTHIVGAHDTSPDNWKGLGTNAVRCVQGSGYSYSTIKGFTLRDGSSGYDWKSSKDGAIRGGGAKTITVVDCVISNCIAHRGGAGHSCKFVRTVITGNSTATGSDYGSGGDACQYLNCLIVRNNGTSMAAYPGVMVNCTVAANTSAAVVKGINTAGPYHFANCVFVNNASAHLNQAPSSGDGRQLAESCVANGNAKMPDADAATVTNAVNFQYRSSAGFDWRLMADAEAVGIGKGAYLEYVMLPECEGGVYRDLNGNAIDPESASIDAGCFQGNHFPTVESGSMIVFTGGGVRVDGLGDFTAADWIVSARFPEMFRFKSATAAKAYSFFNSDAASLDGTFSGYYQHYPDEDGWARYVANPDRLAVNRVLMNPVAAELYVNPVTGNDANDGSAEHPLRTLQAANDAATVDYTLVHAAPGIYAEGGARNFKTSGGVELAAFSNRLCVTRQRVAFVADVPRSAVIMGASDPDTGGLGTNAMRCVAVAAAHPVRSYLRGFDITGGHAHDDYADEAFFYGAAVHCAGECDFEVIDCVVSNNYGCNSLLYFGTALRSKFVGNRAKNNALLRGSRAFDCVFADNDLKSYSVGYVAEIAGCTVDGGGKGLGLGHGSSTKAYMNGSVVENCRDTSVAGLSAEPVASYLNAVLDAAHFADAAAYDYRLSVLSPAVNLVTPADFAAVNCWWQYFGLDAYGAEPVFDANGRFNAGASRAAPLPYVVIGVGNGTTVTGGTAGTNVITDTSATITFNASAETRPFDGFVRNGEVIRPQSGKTWSVNVADLANGDTVGVNYTGTWYVDASRPDDSGDGFTSATAKRTLVGAATNAVSGETVLVAPGTYSEGTAKDAATQATASRVVVPAGVTLQSTTGREVTFIRGASDTFDPDDVGNGTNAVRCVYLNNNATLRGFTLFGGRTQYAGAKQYSVDLEGGGVYGEGGASSLVQDCVIYDCSAHVGGAGFYAAFEDCVISNCTCAIGDGVGGSRSQISRLCNFRNCLFDYFTKSSALELFSRVESCTFGSNVPMPVLYNAQGTDYPHAVNCVFLGAGKVYGWDALLVLTNCVFGPRVQFPAVSASCQYQTNGCVVAAADRLVFDGGYRPVVGSNVCVDAALEEFCGDETKDAYGNQRVMNGVRDIGAAEADWRPRYARDLGPGITVTAADEDAVEVAGPAVRLPASAEGKSFAVTLRKAKPYLLQVRVAVGATLTVTKDGSAVASFSAAEGVQGCKYVPTAANETLVFTVTGENGNVEIVGCRYVPGMTINFR